MAGENDPNDVPSNAPSNAPAPESEGSAAEAMDRLNQSNRILCEARMLPRSKPLTDEQTNEVRERYKVYTGQSGASGAQVARECGYSKSVVSEWLTGKYVGSMDKVTHAVNDWMERDSRRAKAQRPKDFVSTKIAENIRTLVSQADKRCMIGVIVAPAGCGKTKVLKILTEQMRGVYLYCDQQLTPREFLRTLADALGRKNLLGTRAELQRWIVNALLGTNRIVFLDEAHQLGAALNCVRSIHDQAAVPIVMAGTADILQHVDDRSDGRGQFASRCLFYNAMETALDVERPDGNKAGRDLFTLEEIRAFFAMKQMRLADDALELCWSLACLPNHGTLRLIETTVDIVLDMQPELELITRKHVLLALRLRVGEQATISLQRVAARHLELSRAA